MWVDRYSVLAGRLLPEVPHYRPLYSGTDLEEANRIFDQATEDYDSVSLGHFKADTDDDHAFTMACIFGGCSACIAIRERYKRQKLIPFPKLWHRRLRHYTAPSHTLLE